MSTVVRLVCVFFAVCARFARHTWQNPRKVWALVRQSPLFWEASSKERPLLLPSFGGGCRLIFEHPKIVYALGVVVQNEVAKKEKPLKITVLVLHAHVSD